MEKIIEDKLFFLNKIKFKKDGSYLFVDFGCGDGEIIDALYSILKNYGIHTYYIGYDTSASMIELAKSKFSHQTDNYEVLFTNSWKEVMDKVNGYSNMESILILSSMLPEIYSYAKSQSDVVQFWDMILGGNFNHICIRDMMVSENENHDVEFDMFDFEENNFPHFSDRRKYWTDFIKHWGSTNNNKNFIHYLLKYRWTINWEKEVSKNYLPIYIEKLLEKFKNKYTLFYFERFRVPYLEECWKEDFGIELDDYTHVKIIFNLK